MDTGKLIAKLGYWAGELDLHEESINALIEVYEKNIETSPILEKALLGLLYASTQHIIQSIEKIRDELCEEYCEEIKDNHD